MNAHARQPTTDEELGKRDDDFKPRQRSNSMSSYMPWQWRKRRLALLGVLALFILYELVTYMPSNIEINHRIALPQQPEYNVTDSMAPPSDGASSGPPPSVPPPAGVPSAAPSNTADSQAGQHYFEGKIKFYNLRESLQSISHTNGAKTSNRNVLFAASSLKSAANLIPMACEMARVDRNYVHLALFGRNTLSIKEIQQVNGIDENTCKIIFHDARPDYTEYSTDNRAEVSVSGAMKHIEDRMHPQALIMDDSEVEDLFFSRGMRISADRTFKPLIEVPQGKYEEFFWMTRLDSGSLASWFRPTVDIVIHAPHESSGGMKRLLTSLTKADFTGLRMPRLTIELSSTIQPSLRRFLDGFKWPHVGFGEPPSPHNLLTLHHRIPSARLGSEQASLRAVESFYPAITADHHMLLLSPQAEVSPLFFQYLHFALLEYRYSSWGAGISQEVLGISLDIPTSHINGKDKFSPPTGADLRAQSDKAVAQDESVAFHYQAPSSTASLIFGDKWLVFHDFLAKRLQASHEGKAAKSAKLVSETEPAWMEYLLELVRARAWSMLHPPSSFVTIHNELAQLPEEYSHAEKTKSILESVKHTEASDDEPYLTAPEPAIIKEHEEADPQGGLAPLHKMLPFDGNLPQLQEMPYLLHTGQMLPHSEITDKRNAYIQQFRTEIGGCTSKQAGRARVMDPHKAEDLFCLPGMELLFADEEPKKEPKETLLAVPEPPIDIDALKAINVGAAAAKHERRDAAT